MCECIKAPGVIAGWKCCHCPLGIYNGLQRQSCKVCGKTRCKPLLPDSETGAEFETYEEAYEDDPVMLAAVNEQLARAAQGAS
jgi:hypothetical protein